MNVKRSVIRQILNLELSCCRYPYYTCSTGLKRNYIVLSEYINKEKTLRIECKEGPDGKAYDIEVSLKETDETIIVTLEIYRRYTHVCVGRVLFHQSIAYHTYKYIRKIEIDLIKEDVLSKKFPALSIFGYEKDEYFNIAKYYFDPNYEKVRKLLDLIPVGYTFNPYSKFREMPRKNLSSRDTFLFYDCGTKYNMYFYVPEDENEELEIKVYNEGEKIKTKEWKISNTTPELTLVFNGKYGDEKIIFKFNEDEYFQIIEKDEYAIYEERERQKMAKKIKQEREEFWRTHNILPFEM